MEPSLVLLIYDIPEDSEIGNPSGIFRRFAIRLNKSCWLMNENDIPYSLLHQWTQNEIVWHVIRQDTRRNQQLINIGLTEMKKEIKAFIRNARTSMDRLHQELEDTGESLTEAIVTHRRKVNGVIRRLRETLTELRSAAYRFGITGEQLSMRESLERANALQTTARAKARVYFESVLKLQEKLGHRNDCVKAAKADKVPGWMLADMLEDQEEDSGSLRDLFG